MKARLHVCRRPHTVSAEKTPETLRSPRRPRTRLHRSSGTSERLLLAIFILAIMAPKVHAGAATTIMLFVPAWVFIPRRR